MAHGFLHWSANFDELQDFEDQIRNFSMGSGLMDQTDYDVGDRDTPLGLAKAGSARTSTHWPPTFHRWMNLTTARIEMRMAR